MYKQINNYLVCKDIKLVEEDRRKYAINNNKNINKFNNMRWKSITFSTTTVFKINVDTLNYIFLMLLENKDDNYTRSIQ